MQKANPELVESLHEFIVVCLACPITAFDAVATPQIVIAVDPNMAPQEKPILALG